MDTAEMKGLVRRYLGHSNSREIEEMNQLRAPDFVAHVPRDGPLDDAVPLTANELNKDLVMIAEAFPDLTNTPRDVVAEGDRVSVRCVLRGTFEGRLGAIAGDGSVIAWDTVHIYRLEKGLLAEAWFVTDTLGLLQQAGAVKVTVGDPEQAVEGGDRP